MSHIIENESKMDVQRQAVQALYLWGVFIALAVTINGTVPFILGFDLHTWTYSPLKDVAFNLLVYGGLFLVVPLALTKSWATVLLPCTQRTK